MNKEYTAIYDLEFGKRHGLHETVKIRIKKYPKGTYLYDGRDYPAGAYLEPLHKCSRSGHEDTCVNTISLISSKVTALLRLHKNGCSIKELYEFFMKALDSHGHFYAVEVFDWFFGSHICCHCQFGIYEELRDSILDECADKWESHLEDEVKKRLGLNAPEQEKSLSPDARIKKLEDEVELLKKCLYAHVDKHR